MKTERTYRAEPEFIQERVVMAAFKGDKRTIALRMTPEQAMNLASDLQSAAGRVMQYQREKAA